MPHKTSIYQLFLPFWVMLCFCAIHTRAQEQAVWKPLRSHLPRLSSIVANSTGTVIVAGESGAFISANTGATWTALNNFPPGRLLVSASGDFYVFGAAVWRFNNTLQRFEQLVLANRSTSGFQNTLGFVSDLATSSSGSILLLAIKNKGLVRITATTIATVIVSTATITTANVTGVTANPRTGEFFAAWNNALWTSRDEGISWQMMTSVNFSHTTQRLLFGRTRLLQSGGSASPVCSDVFPLFCTDAMWERDDYTLLATPQGIVVQRNGDTTPTFTCREQLTFLPDTPFDKGLRVVQFAESGNTLFAITEQGVFCADEIPIGKANPFLALPQKYLRWRECNLGLSGVVEGINIVQNSAQNTTQNSAQSTIITRSGWILRDSTTSWKNIQQDSMRIMAHIQTPDSALLAVSFRTDSQTLLRSMDYGNTWTAATYILPRGHVWLTDPKSIQQPRALQPMLRTSNNALVMFAQDTLVSRIMPTLVVESRDNGRTWQSTIIRGLSENIALGKILASPRGFLFGEDRIFARKTLYRSPDNGKTWQTLDVERVPESLSIHPTSGTLFIAGSPTIFSMNNGTTWQSSRGVPFRSSGRFEGASELAFGSNAALILNIRNLGIFTSANAGETFQTASPLISTAYVVKAAPNGAFYALTQNGVWASTDGGNTWQTRNNGLFGLPSDLVLNDITFDATSTAFLSTSRGIYRLENPRLLPEKNTAQLTTVNDIFTSGERKLRIAPNPSSQEAFVTFTVEEPEFCIVEVVNMRGEVVATLHSGVLAPSVYHIALPLQNLVQGQYFCRLQHGSRTTSELFTVIR